MNHQNHDSQGQNTTTRQMRLEHLATLIEHKCPKHYEAVLVVGSVSRGRADSYSDLEIEFMVSEMPSLEEREQFIESLGGASLTHYGAPLRDGSVWSIFRVDGLWVECGWQVSEQAVLLVERLAAGDILDHDLLVLAATYDEALFLRCSERFHTMRGKLKAYPPMLAKRLILDTLKTWEAKLAWEVREALAKREDRLPLLQRLIVDCQRVLRIVYAINNVWEHDYKWTKQELEHLKIKPDQLAFKLDHILTVWDCESSLETLKQVISEVVNLIPEQLKREDEAQAIISNVCAS